MFIENAYKPENELWKYLIGVICVVAAIVIGQIPWTVAVIAKKGMEVFGMDQSKKMNVLGSNLNLFLILFSFLTGLVVLFLIIRFLHGQKIKEVTTARKKIDWGRFFFGFLLIAVFTIISTAYNYYTNPSDFIINFELGPFLVLCVIAIVMIPIQTSMEEYLFRGYLMQGIGLAAKNRWAPLVLTSVIFGGMHFANPEIDQLGYLVLFDYIAFGFLFGIVTLMDDGMELSLGMHAGNNLVIVLLVTADWTAFQTHSILKDVSEPVSYTWIDMLTTAVFFTIVLFILSKKYHWKNWKEKLFGKLDLPEESKKLDHI